MPGFGSIMMRSWLDFGSTMGVKPVLRVLILEDVALFDTLLHALAHNAKTYMKKHVFY